MGTRPWSHRSARVWSLSIAAISLGLLGLLGILFTNSKPAPVKDYSGIPASQNAHLREVAEPIVMIEGYSWDDGGSLGLSFEDSKGMHTAVCLADDLDDNKHFSFESLTPERSTSVPIGGREERAFIGLLQRWYRQDPEAQEWLGRIERRSRLFSHPPLLTGNETDPQRARLFAVVMMRKLLRRN